MYVIISVGSFKSNSLHYKITAIKNSITLRYCPMDFESKLRVYGKNPFESH